MKEYGQISGARYEWYGDTPKIQLYINYREGVCLELGQTGSGFFGRLIDTQDEYNELKDMICLYKKKSKDEFKLSDFDGLIVEFESYKNGKIKDWRIMHELIFNKG